MQIRPLLYKTGQETAGRNNMHAAVEPVDGGGISHSAGKGARGNRRIRRAPRNRRRGILERLYRCQDILPISKKIVLFFCLPAKLSEAGHRPGKGLNYCPKCGRPVIWIILV
jgi:hypothetical protein